jgi:hypothetical protein
MTEINLEANKERFIVLLSSILGTKSMSDIAAIDIINYLDETDFYIAPASTKYHGAYIGGLCEHSLSVYDNILKVENLFYSHKSDGDRYSLKSLTLVSLLHDVCKINIYKEKYRNVQQFKEDNFTPELNEKGKPIWARVKGYEVIDSLPLGHGEKSVIILQKFMQLSIDEIIAIRWHMGGYDDLTKTFIGNITANNAFNNYPLVTLLHIADLSSIFLEPLKDIEPLSELEEIYIQYQAEQDLRKEAF